MKEIEKLTIDEAFYDENVIKKPASQLQILIEAEKINEIIDHLNNQITPEPIIQTTKRSISGYMSVEVDEWVCSKCGITTKEICVDNAKRKAEVQKKLNEILGYEPTYHTTEEVVIDLIKVIEKLNKQNKEIDSSKVSFEEINKQKVER